MRIAFALALLLPSAPAFAQGGGLARALAIAREERFQAEEKKADYESSLAQDEDILRKAVQAANAAARDAAQKAVEADRRAVDNAKVRLKRAELWLAALDRAAAAGGAETPSVATALKGQVRLRRPDGTEAGARAGSSFAKGDRVVVSKDSMVELRFEDGSSVVLGAGCDFVLTEPPAEGRPKSSYDLFAGYLHWETGPGFKGASEMRTPTAVAAIRGTALDVAIEKSGLTTIRPYEGEIDVSARAENIPVIRRWWEDAFK